MQRFLHHIASCSQTFSDTFSMQYFSTFGNYFGIPDLCFEKNITCAFSDVSSGGVATCSMKNQKCCVKDQVIWGWKVLVSPPTHAVVV